MICRSAVYRLLVLLVLATTLFCGSREPAGAQVFDYAHARLPLGSTAGQWRFDPGDDPRYASPSWDDSQWKTLSSDDTWAAQGYPKLTGFAWYRFKLVIPKNGPSFSLILPEMYTAYQCYIDGKLITTVGLLPPSRILDYTVITPVPIPPANTTDSVDPEGRRTVQVAIRVWHSPIWSTYVGGGPTQGSSTNEVFGPTTEIQRFKTRNTQRLQFLRSVWLGIGLVDVLAGLASLSLFLLRRSEKEYLWFGFAVLTPGLPLLLNYYSIGRMQSIELVDGLALFATMTSHLAFLAFYRRLLQAPRDWLFRLAVVCILCNPIPLFLLEGVGVLSIGHANVLNQLLQWPYEIWILWLLIRRSFAKRADARLLLAPIAMIFGLEQLGAVTDIARSYGAPVRLSIDDWVMNVPFDVSATNIAWLMFLLAMLIILLYRFARTRQEEEQYAAEFASARQIQQVLVPETLAPVRGFLVEAEYRPARIVGGDFYQVLPTDGGGLLVVVGDVAGKGLPAAMLVAMLVGILRTQAVLSPEPSAVLQTLNERLLGRASGGFSTCVVALISAQGELKLANAGHPAPYLNGEEVPVEGALPLGIVTGEIYPTMTLQMRKGDRLVFVTDGVPEARNTDLHLLGFEETRRLSRESAVAIVEAAQRFGQEDDLTVVTVEFQGTAEVLEPAA